MPPEQRNFVAGVAPVEQSAGGDAAWWFVFRGGDVLIHADYASGSVIPRVSAPSELDLVPIRTSFIGQLGGEDVYAVELPDDATAPDAHSFRGLRALYGLVDDQ